VSWRWLTDMRGPEPRVDWTRLAVVLAASCAMSAVLAMVLSPAVFLVAALIAAPALIYIDVRLRRERAGP
jgi:hypothetical protein